MIARVEAQSPSPIKPKVPPGVDPGGIAIALIGPGIDYTDAQIAQRLARDGEGEAIAWDAADGDARPYASAGATGSATGDGTALAKLLLAAYPAARLVPVRIDAGDRDTVRRGLAFAAQTPARILALPAWNGADWASALLRELAVHRPDLLLLVPHDRAQGAGALENLVRVAAHAHPSVAEPPVDLLVTIDGMAGSYAAGSAAIGAARAVVLAAATAACAQHGRRMGAAEIKAALLARAVEAGDGGPRRLLDARCPVERMRR